MNAPLADGAIFTGRYRVVRCLAAGGMGAVYEVVHLETERRRALKVMHPHLFQSAEMRERFKREARIAAQVESEYIVDVSDAGVDEATQMPFLVMELLRGEELGDMLARLGRLPPADVVTYLQQAAWALDRTHAASIVHRDLKPANLFVTRREDGTPRIKILDFGVAKLVAESASAGVTRSLGTPLYMPPEQFRASGKLTAAADIYALVMMAYTLLVGEPYWTPEASSTGDVIAFALVTMHGPQESAVRRAGARGVTLPPGFDAWFARGTAANPALRFPTATEAVRALGEVLATGPGAGTTAQPAPVPVPAPEPPALSFRTTEPGMPALAGAGLLARASTSTGGLLTTAPVERSRPSRAPVLAVLAILGLGAVGGGAWLLSRATSGSRGSAEAPPAPIAAAPAPVVSPGAPAEPVPAESAAAPPPSASAVTGASASPTPKPRMAAPTAAPVIGGGSPGSAPKPPVKKLPPASKLLGRD